MNPMYTRKYHELLKYLMERYGLLEENVIFVENIADWCRKCGIHEPDDERPLKLILQRDSGSKMLIMEDITDKILNARMNALNIQGQLISVAHNRAEALNSDEKKLTYLFLNEIAHGLYEMHDDLIADDWAFEEMGKMGFLES